MQDERIGVVAHFTIHEGRLEEFTQAARDATAHVQANEPDGLVYEWYVAQDGRSAVLYEVWASPDALVAHLQGTVGTQMLPILMSAGAMTNAEFFGTATPELRATVEGLPVTDHGAAFAELDR